MADERKKVASNVAGEFFVDTSCIDCDTCRQLAPATFGDDGEHAFVALQPAAAEERRAALRALVACPTGSIGRSGADAPSAKADLAAAVADFPLPIEAGVAYCGFASPDSFGASSYFVVHEEGNWLVDSPRWSAHLEKRFEAAGGIARIFLTHRDDVADAGRWAERFGARRILHRQDLDAEPGAEIVLDGREPVRLTDDFVAVPVPGHTAGSAVLVYRGRYLFSGDHLWWSRRRGRLWASREACWHDWREQTESMARLARAVGEGLEWVLPGHGERAKFTPGTASRELARLAEDMRAVA